MNKESTQFVRSKLVNYTEADCSDQSVENNRAHYHLKFENDIGWSWVQGQVAKLSAELEVNLELWKIRPSGMHAFELDVREIERRERIDTSQRGLSEFEQ